MEDSVNRHSVECSGTLPDAAIDGLSGADLDAAVAKAQGYMHKVIEMYTEDCRSKFMACLIAEHGAQWSKRTTDMTLYRPSRDWAQGGPIVERARIAVLMMESKWHAFMPAGGGYDPAYWLFEMTSTQSDGSGPTPLIAAMRAYVASTAADRVPKRSTE